MGQSIFLSTQSQVISLFDFDFFISYNLHRYKIKK